LTCTSEWAKFYRVRNIHDILESVVFVRSKLRVIVVSMTANQFRTHGIDAAKTDSEIDSSSKVRKNSCRIYGTIDHLLTRVVYCIAGKKL
jgi:hypothetical protein